MKTRGQNRYESNRARHRAARRTRTTRGPARRRLETRAATPAGRAWSSAQRIDCERNWRGNSARGFVKKASSAERALGDERLEACDVRGERRHVLRLRFEPDVGLGALRFLPQCFEDRCGE